MSLLISLKIILISAGAISIAMAVLFSIPSMIAFTYYDLPVVWKSLLTWLRPPYLYFIINGIIIIIAASSRSTHHHHHQSRNSSVSYQSRAPQLISVRTPPPSDVEYEVVSAQREEAEELDRRVVEVPALPLPEVELYAAEDEDEEDKVVEVMPVVVNGVELETVGNDDVDDMANDEWVVSESSVTPSRTVVSPEAPLDFVLPEKQKPLTASRFGHRKPIKASTPEGERALRMARPEKEETLESTWKMITEGRHVPRTRQLKKCDTLENHDREVMVNTLADRDFTPSRVPKSRTFKDRTNYDVQTVQLPSLTPVPGKIINKEPSPSQDELNRRVEAFIKNFQEEMKLQRQESLNQYMEMINRGAN